MNLTERVKKIEQALEAASDRCEGCQNYKAPPEPVVKTAKLDYGSDERLDIQASHTDDDDQITFTTPGEWETRVSIEKAEEFGNKLLALVVEVKAGEKDNA